METIYQLSQVTKRYAGQATAAVDDVSLTVARGEVFGILGANGAGKSTLVKMMVNLLRADKGVVQLLGRDITQNPLFAPLNVGYMPQESDALNNLTVAEALYFSAHLRGVSRSEARAERERLLRLWQIEPLRKKYNNRLSGGQKRLLRLAVAMAGKPPILILDEPTNDLDPARRKLVWEVLRQENQTRGTTIIFITHDAVEAEKVIQRVAIMADGRIVALGKPAELKRALSVQVKLEIFFSPPNTPQLPMNLPIQKLEPGRWLISLKRSEIAATLSQLNWEKLDDFHLYAATLEDLYLHFAHNDAMPTE